MKKNQRWQWTVADFDLLQRACNAAPDLFRRFEVVVVGPLADDDVELPACEFDADDASPDDVDAAAIIERARPSK